MQGMRVSECVVAFLCLGSQRMRAWGLRIIFIEGPLRGTA